MPLDEITYKAGDRFLCLDYNDEYILVVTDYINEKYLMTLIHVKSGNRWTRPIRVKDSNNVTTKEMNKIVGNGTFKKVTQ